MSEVNIHRYDVNLCPDRQCDCGASFATEECPDSNGDYVRYADYVAEVAALREDLEKWQGIAGRRTGERTEFMNERDDTQQRLTAAEQRNAETSATLRLATKLLHQTLAALNPSAELAKNIRALLKDHRTKPTESIASECSACDGLGKRIIGGELDECPNCEGGKP